MWARSVSIRFGCLFFAAAFTVSAQFVERSWMSRAASGSTGVISLSRLGHKIPWKAQKEYERAARLQQQGKAEQAAPHLRKALAIDPQYVDAANDLGACYAQMNRFEDARTEFEAATRMDSLYWSGYFNLAMMYALEGHFADAERAARTAIDLNRTGNGVRLMLGMALVLQSKYTDEALGLLRKAQQDFPQAHLLLARALAGRGQKSSARGELEEYLHLKEAAAKDLAESWLEDLK